MLKMKPNVQMEYGLNKTHIVIIEGKAIYVRSLHMCMHKKGSMEIVFRGCHIITFPALGFKEVENQMNLRIKAKK